MDGTGDYSSPDAAEERGRGLVARLLVSSGALVSASGAASSMIGWFIAGVLLDVQAEVDAQVGGEGLPPVLHDLLEHRAWFGFAALGATICGYALMRRWRGTAAWLLLGSLFAVIPVAVVLIGFVLLLEPLYTAPPLAAVADR